MLAWMPNWYFWLAQKHPDFFAFFALKSPDGRRHNSTCDSGLSILRDGVWSFTNKQANTLWMSNRDRSGVQNYSRGASPSTASLMSSMYPIKGRQKRQWGRQLGIYKISTFRRKSIVRNKSCNHYRCFRLVFGEFSIRVKNFSPLQR